MDKKQMGVHIIYKVLQLASASNPIDHVVSREFG